MPEDEDCMQNKANLVINDKTKIISEKDSKEREIKKNYEYDVFSSEFTPNIKNQVEKWFIDYSTKLFKERDVKQHNVFFIKDKEKMIAAAVVRVFWGSLVLKYIFVEEEYRNLGLGNLLLKECIAYAKLNHCKFITLRTMYEKAVSYYERHGFVVEHVMKGYSAGRSSFLVRLDL